jgi:23S rRNA-/tRNA-specific pseudouridylate synthase
VHAGGGYIRNTLIAMLRETRGDELRLAHRLDRETSGVVLLAKSREAARALEQEFHHRRVLKEYVAILRGTAPEDFTVNAPIAKRRTPLGLPMRVVDPELGKPARSRFLRVAVRPGEPGPPGAASGGAASRSLVLIRPESGRTNQIRVHACWAGHPVVGDKVYGRPAAAAGERPVPGWGRADTPDGARRHLLHCFRVALRHPSGGLLDVSAPPPPDFELAWGGPLPSFAVSWPGLDSMPFREPDAPGLPFEGRLP